MASGDDDSSEPPSVVAPGDLPVADALAAAALDTHPTEVAIVDDDGEIVYTNRAWREFGEANDIDGSPGSLGRNYLEAAAAGDDEYARRAVDGLGPVLAGERETFSFEYPCHSPDAQRWFLMEARRFAHGGESYALLMHLDITDRKLAELQVREQNEQLEAVARMLAHDLRNPLNVVDGRLGLLAEEVDSDHLPPLRDGIDRMERIVEEALTFARQSAVPDADLSDLDLASVARSAWEHVETGTASLAVANTMALRGSEGPLLHVLENLFRNAVEHGDRSATITVGALADGDGFYVEDDGPGIPAADRSAVFDTGFTTNDEGTGFGLAIVRQVADAHGWGVRVTDGADGGARFEFAGVEPAA